LGGSYTPQIQEDMSRLGAKMPFEQVLEEIDSSHHVWVSEATVRRTTYESGVAAEALVRAEVTSLSAADAPPASAKPEKLLVSVDGALVHLTSGEWREVKSVAVGEFSCQWDSQAGEYVTHSHDLSYFSRSYRAREFEQAALAELYQRGLDNAQTVVAVNDGAAWIQQFIDYHCPGAVRIIDFSHVLEYIAAAGKAIWGEGSEAFKQWFARMAHQLKHHPPQRTLAELRLLLPKAKTESQLDSLDSAIFYIQSRLQMMDYPHFRHRGYPIGSGSVESSHKGVVQARLKLAGMRWAPAHVDPMLALRNLVCNHRWADTWPKIVAYRRQLLWQKRREAIAQRQSKPASQPAKRLSLADLMVAPSPQPQPPPQPISSRPSADHPWRNNLWPTREAWRWASPQTQY
jgi:hypothetical protein